jgi:hypothetical protein
VVLQELDLSPGGGLPVVHCRLQGPAITRRPSSGLLDVFGQGGDSQIWGSTFNGTSWDGFAPIPNGVTPSSPAAWSPASGVVDVLVRGTNGTVWVNRFQ